MAFANIGGLITRGACSGKGGQGFAGVPLESLGIHGGAPAAWSEGQHAMNKTGYEQDFHAWLNEQAAHLRAKAWGALDIDNLVEEIESLGREQRHAIRSHLCILLIHLLKWAYQPERRPESWLASIGNARAEIDGRLEMSPSLRRELSAFMSWAYPRARQAAADETGLPKATFPETCPWGIDQLQAPDFWPET
jgi:Domain of unknown function DUF29